MTIERTSGSEGETRRLAADLAIRLRPGDCVALIGDLGAGKTCFVRGMAEGLGLLPSQVSSPTFVLMHEHERPGKPSLVHIDAYRLRGGEDAESLAMEEALDGAIAAIEWPERIADLLPEGRIEVRIEHEGPPDACRRRITIAAPPEAVECLEGLWA